MRIDRAGAAVLLAASFCRNEPSLPSVAAGRMLRSHGEPGRSVVGLIPSEAPAGVVFQRQPDGRAGLAVLGTGFERGDTVHWGGKALATTYSNSRFLTALIPAELLNAPGDVEVTIESPSDPTRSELRTTFRLGPPASAARGR